MTVWLSRIILDTRSRAVRHDLINVVELHRSLMKLVPDDLGERPRAAGGLLFRVDETPRGPSLLIQTAAKPRVDALPEHFGQIDFREITPLLAHIEEGQRVRYRIAANPTKRLGNSVERERRGKIAVLRGDNAVQWWQGKARAAGLEPHTVLWSPRSDVTGSGNVRHAVAQFDGVAHVAHPERVRRAVREGIGRGKAYGCGLLSLGLEQAE